MTIDLPAQEIRGPDGGTIKFSVDAFRKHCMLNGLDDIGLTMEKADSISVHTESFHTNMSIRTMTGLVIC